MPLPIATRPPGGAADQPSDAICIFENSATVTVSSNFMASLSRGPSRPLPALRGIDRRLGNVRGNISLKQSQRGVAAAGHCSGTSRSSISVQFIAQGPPSRHRLFFVDEIAKYSIIADKPIILPDL